MTTVRTEGTFDFCAGCPANNNCCVRKRHDGYGRIEAPFVLESEADRLEAVTGLHKLEFTEAINNIDGTQTLALQTVDNLCRFYKSGRCSVYGARPLDCRLFPFDIVQKADLTLWWIVYSDLCPVKFEFEKYFIAAKRLLEQSGWTMRDVRRYSTHNASAMTKHNYQLIETVALGKELH